MSDHSSSPLTLTVDADHPVSALLCVPAGARSVCALAHGAGAGMTHPHMEAAAQGLAERGIATLRYQFPFMERGSKRPDAPALAHATVRAAVAEAQRRLPQLPLVAGGRSFGGRMTSQAQAICALPHVRGLVFLAFPLHPAGRPADERAAHLLHVQCPMLFLQGTRDELADAALLGAVVARLGSRASLQSAEGADHAFHVPAPRGQGKAADAAVLARLLDGTARWIDTLV